MAVMSDTPEAEVDAHARELVELLDRAVVDKQVEAATTYAMDLARRGIQARGSVAPRGTATTPAEEQLAIPSHLVREVGNDDPKLRGALAFAIGEWGGVDAAAALAEVLATERDDTVGAFLVRALGTIGGATAAAALADAARSGSDSVRRHALATLETLTAQRRVDYTQPVKSGSDIADPSLRPVRDALAELAANDRTRVGEDARTILRRLEKGDTTPRGEYVFDGTRTQHSEPTVTRRAHEPDATVLAMLEQLKLALDAGDTAVATRHARELGQAGVQERGSVRPRGTAVEVAPRELEELEMVEVALRSSDAGLRTAAAFALGEWGGEEAAKALAHALAEETDVVTGQYLVRALGTIGGLVATEALGEAVGGGRDTIQRAAAATLEALNSLERVDYTQPRRPVATDSPTPSGPILLNALTSDTVARRHHYGSAGREYALRIDENDLISQADIHLENSDDVQGPRTVRHIFDLHDAYGVSPGPAVVPTLDLRDSHFTEYLVRVGSGSEAAYFIARPAVPRAIGPRYEDAAAARDLAQRAANSAPPEGALPHRARPSPQSDVERLRIAQATVFRGGDEDTGRELEALTHSEDRDVAIQARIRLGFLHRTGTRAVKWLEDAARRAKVRNSPPELCIELARAWMRIGEHERAEEVYQQIVKSRQATNFKPLACYRLGELCRDRGDLKAATVHWRRAFEANNENVSPYAGYALAAYVETRRLPMERVWSLYLQARNSSHLELSKRARLDLADFLARHHQYGHARQHLKSLVGIGDDVLEAAVGRRLRLLEVDEAAAPQFRPIDDAVNLRATAVEVLAPRFAHALTGKPQRRVVIVGAGLGGQYLLDAILRESEPPVVCGFVDDDDDVIPPAQRSLLGSTAQLAQIIRREQVDEVLLAIPTAPGKLRAAVWRACEEAEVPLLNLPPLHELYLGWDREHPTVRYQLRPVLIHEMLGDDPVYFDGDATKWVEGLHVMVMGATEVGAEVCRRFAHGRVERLTVVDPDEAARAELRDDLARRDFTSVDFVGADYTEARTIARHMRQLKPNVVIYAAGARIEELMTDDPDDAPLREVRSARMVAAAAGKTEVPTLLYVSDVRAAAKGSPFAWVKELAEDAVLSHQEIYPFTRYTVVRTRPFANGRGSVIAQTEARIKDVKAGAVDSEQVDVPGGEVHLLSVARGAELILHTARIASQGGVDGLVTLDAGVRANMTHVADQMVRLAALPSEQVSIRLSTSSRAAESVEVDGTWLDEELGLLLTPRSVRNAGEVDAAISGLLATGDDSDSVDSADGPRHTFTSGDR